MIKLIVGKKGSGKTKALLELVNKALDQSKGHVVFIEKNAKLLYDISHKARLLDADSYDIHGYDAFYGFISGMCAGDYDITDIFIDGTLKIGGNDLAAFAQFNQRLLLWLRSMRSILCSRYRPMQLISRTLMPARLCIRNCEVIGSKTARPF